MYRLCSLGCAIFYLYTEYNNKKEQIMIIKLIVKSFILVVMMISITILHQGCKLIEGPQMWLSR